MKKSSLKGKLALSKATISNLNMPEMQDVRGGALEPSEHPLTECCIVVSVDVACNPSRSLHRH